ncbi:agamous-like MADS-box protein AGL82 [Juglans microcarpa x Juglans regia]|uniref:agamous-like MADS-box protein AGL82 n=1 Tax=Juglans microcarpa x Juglans regia TaxID=2249226 RepID=UPI001B7E8DE4|nr:agamous-like MADS-box protein AGL82 [Juglans microcarpa x Juglans regia]
MGRGKLPMEIIRKEKSRITTFQKRKRGLMKKAYEFSTLCGSDTCMIIYGPKSGDRELELGTWPQDRAEVDRIINKYKTDSTLKRARGAFDLSDFFVDRNKRVEVEIKKLRKNILMAKYPTWDDRIELLTEDQLRLLLDVMDAKIEGAGLRINMMKGNQNMMEKATTSRLVAGGHNGPQPEVIRSHFNSMQALYQDQMSKSPLNPLETQWTPQFQIDHQGSQMLIPFDPSLGDNPFMKLLHGTQDHWTQHGAGSASQTHAPLNGLSNYNMMSGVLDNMIWNNPGAPMNYNDLMITRQLTPHHILQCPTMPNLNYSHVHNFQVNELYDIHEFDMKNKHLI